MSISKVELDEDKVLNDIEMELEDMKDGDNAYEKT